MKYKTLFLFFFIASISAQAQDENETPRRLILEEGKRLYRSEMASWYGTDLLMEHTPDRSHVGGYFSYTDNEIARCIFFSNEDVPKVIGSITFDSTYNTKTAQMDFSERKFTEQESALYVIRNLALEEMGTDTLFKKFKDTSPNLIPLIYGNEKKVYILTGPKNTGVVIFGNDYLLRFDEKNKLIDKKKLHQNIIPIEYKERSDTSDEVVTMHSHLEETGEFITATDVCTLMLYEKFTNWSGHNVIGKNYISVWNCDKDTLFFISRKAVKRIVKDQEKREKKKE